VRTQWRRRLRTTPATPAAYRHAEHPPASPARQSDAQAAPQPACPPAQAPKTPPRRRSEHTLLAKPPPAPEAGPRTGVCSFLYCMHEGGLHKAGAAGRCRVPEGHKQRAAPPQSVPPPKYGELAPAAHPADDSPGPRPRPRPRHDCRRMIRSHCSTLSVIALPLGCPVLRCAQA